MRVLFLTNIPTPYRIDFFNAFGKLCELTVAFERSDASNRDKNWLENQSTDFKSIYLKGVKIGEDSSFSPSILKYLKMDLFDVIIIGGYSTPTGMLAIQYLNMKKIPFVLNTDGGFIKSENPLKHWIKKHFIGSAYMWLSTGKKTASYLNYYGADLDRIFCYPFTSLMKSDIAERILTISEKKLYKDNLSISEEKMVISIGQFIPRKGFDNLIRSAATIQKNIGVYIIGGEPIQEYFDIIKSLNISNVHFVKFQTKYELDKYYNASDLFVLPTREDIWGLVINEAMAHGLPIITTEMCISGDELIKNGENGFIVPIDNLDLLSKAINSVLGSESLTKSMSQENLDKIKTYTIENMANEIFGILTHNFKFEMDRKNEEREN